MEIVNNNLTELVATIDKIEICGTIPVDTKINKITSDSRDVQLGDLFIAYDGIQIDGHQFIGGAIENGAIAIIGEKEILSLDVPYIRVRNGRKALSKISAAYFNFPANKLRIIGITGTDGKTTTSSILYHIFSEAGISVASITTIEAAIKNSREEIGVHVTTPPAFELQRYLAQMVENEVTAAIIETTSHGLDQFRVEDCYYDIAAITNVSNEHLDYHNNFQQYLLAKTKLFNLLDNKDNLKQFPKYGILNVDDVSYSTLEKIVEEKVVTYGIENHADFRATNITFSDEGTTFTLSYQDKKTEVETNLLGKHNLYNSLAAIAIAMKSNVPIQAIISSLGYVPSIQGRLDRIDLGQKFKVFVDYAHTANGLKNLLELAAKIKQDKVILVFGLSGGARDKSKREAMGRIAAQSADKVIVTAVDW
ncbi:MAG: UDP-N-acetylmuramoyl-L-alanyl-D-glutamate--2,6-diaminopimelate ligase, partial [Bacteroidetes bacterium]|nr:UDP-N-acetylmuramoyl-L-alanyl-D-glutamate--2,6-diaminopimelate ligase [Bacteroidota bacterium]